MWMVSCCAVVVGENVEAWPGDRRRRVACCADIIAIEDVSMRVRSAELLAIMLGFYDRKWRPHSGCLDGLALLRRGPNTLQLRVVGQTPTALDQMERGTRSR